MDGLFPDVAVRILADVLHALHPAAPRVVPRVVDARGRHFVVPATNVLLCNTVLYNELVKTACSNIVSC